MERKSFQDMDCPIALSLERVGEWWSILILRDATHGLTRFDEFQKSLGIAPNSLTRRLSALVEAGLLERRRYSDRPPRYEYVLTETGHAFRPVLIALFAFGASHFPPAKPNVRLVDKETGSDVDPMLIDRVTGHPIDEEHTTFLPGPGADDRLRAALERRNEQAA
ncbi:winged helix-turn-helix transcriptional regulator [Streptomyces chartreusis]|uniref:winged helix-turn-helix transcriptional regulator n=1 Tax=Streptomyces chartreusis TaxID=1969 RepID=UPI0036252A38